MAEGRGHPQPRGPTVLPAGRGKRAWPSPENLTAAEECALIVTCLWEEIRNQPVEPKGQPEWDACNAMWEASGQDPLSELGLGDGWVGRLQLARKLLDAPVPTAEEAKADPAQHGRRMKMLWIKDLADRPTAYAKRKADQERVAKVRARVEQEREAKGPVKH